MYQKYVKSISFFLVGFFSIIVGILIIIKNITLYSFFINLISVVFFINGLALIGKSLFNKEKRTDIWRGFLNVVIGFLMLLFPSIPTSFLSLLFSIYLFINGGIDIVYYVVLKKNNVGGRIIHLLKAIFFFLLALVLLFSPLLNLKYVLILLGSYLILFGLSSVMDFISEVFSIKGKKSFKKRISISLPIFMTTFIPYSVLKDMNTYLEGDNAIPIGNSKKNLETYDLEVFIHVSSEDSTGAIGHVDLWYNGEIISYGNYDMKSRRLKETVGDGVLFLCKSKEKYIEFCQKHSHKILFGFGIELTEKEKQKVADEISKLKENTYEWIPYYKRALLEKRKIEKNTYKDYASTLYKMTKSKFYKFNSGKFKTFFIFTTNCVALADIILGAAGTGIMKITGFISPGRYYDYLYREFCRKNSKVVSYKIYTKKGDFYE